MHFNDLDLCHYHRGALDADRWSVPLRAIGWLEHPHPYTTGTVPAALPRKLAELIAQTRGTFWDDTFIGRLHECDLCAATPGFEVPESSINLIIPGDGEVFAAPGATLHYIEAHAYRPPESFVSAVLTCLPADSAEYLAALRRVNKGRAIPFLPREEFYRQRVIAFHVGLRFIEQLGGPPVPEPRQPVHPDEERRLRLLNAHVEDPALIRQQAEVAQRFRAALGRALVGAPRQAVVRAAQSAHPDWIALLDESQLWFGPARIHYSAGKVSGATPNTDWPIS